jgi:hypothetical protein
MPKPSITFFCELGKEELTKLFDGRFVIDDLKGLDARLSLGILDLSKERASVVKRLNTAGVPVVAWLLLPEEEGYWFNIDNAPLAIDCYARFKNWTKEHNLNWYGVGLDIEMDIADLRQVMNKQPIKKLLPELLKRYKNKQRILQAQDLYQTLVDNIHDDGYQVENYHIPLIIDERRAKSTVLQRIAGLVDLKTDHEVLMLYSSFFRPHGEAILWSYAHDTESVGIGVTGGGVDVEGLINRDPLTWLEFSRDLRLCVKNEKPIHVFSLEGCVQQDFLTKLNTFNWDKPITKPKGVAKIALLRLGLRALLWLLERPWMFIIGLITLLGFRLIKKDRQPV